MLCIAAARGRFVQGTPALQKHVIIIWLLTMYLAFSSSVSSLLRFSLNLGYSCIIWSWVSMVLGSAWGGGGKNARYFQVTCESEHVKVNM